MICTQRTKCSKCTTQVLVAAGIRFHMVFLERTNFIENPAETVGFDTLCQKLIKGGNPIGTILEEIKQCDIFCFSCHSIATTVRKFCARQAKYRIGKTLSLDICSNIDAMVDDILKQCWRSFSVLNKPTILTGDLKLDDLISKKMRYCDGCDVPFFPDRDHGVWKNLLFCSNCVKIPEILKEQNVQRLLMNENMIRSEETSCQKCMRPVILQCGEKITKFEFDHINSLAKLNARTVGGLLLTGSSVSDMFLEMRKCRVLCVSCHSAVTYAQRYFGVMGLKDANYSSEKQHQIATQVEDGADFVLWYWRRKFGQCQ